MTQPPGAPSPGGFGPPSYPPRSQEPAGPPQGGGPRRSLRTKAGASAAIILVAALVAGAVVLGTGGDEGEPETDDRASGTATEPGPGGPPLPEDAAPGAVDPARFNKDRREGEAEVSWGLDNSAGTGEGSPTVWVTTDLAVTAAGKKITAVQRPTGSAQWDTVTLPGEICGATPAPGLSDKVVVATADGTGCGTIHGIDLRTGKTDWTSELRVDGASAVGLTIAYETLLVSAPGKAQGYAMKSGSYLWAHGSPRGCTPRSFAAAKASAYLVSACGEGAERHDSLESVDPETGENWKTSRTRRLPKGWEVRNIASVEHSVIAMRRTGGADDATTRYLALDEDGGVRSEFEVRDGVFPDCGGELALGDCPVTAVDDDHIYLPVTNTSGEVVRGEIQAYSLDSGTEAWRAGAPGADSHPTRNAELIPLPGDDSEDVLRAYLRPNEGPGAVYEISRRSGASKKVLQLPVAALATERSLDGRAHTAGNGIVLTSRKIGGAEEDSPMVLAYSAP